MSNHRLDEAATGRRSADEDISDGQASRSAKKFFVNVEIDGRKPDQAMGAVRMLLAGRAWSFLAGPLTLAFIGIALTPDEQGYWYTMVSLLALASLFELGLGQALTIHAAHGGSALIRDESGMFRGPESVLAHIGQLLRLALIWGCGAGILFALVVSVVGAWMLGAEALSSIDWSRPWLVAVLAAGLQLAGGSVLAVFEGLGDNILIARFRLVSGIVASLAVWIALSWGMGLMAVALAPLVQALMSITLLCGVRRQACIDLLSRKDWTFAWQRDFWPLQWRFAVSWLAGYAIFQLATPMVFRILSPADAGRLGMSMALVWALIGVGTAWSNAAAPRFGVLAAAGDHRAMDELLARCLKRGLLLALIGAIMIVTGVIVLRQYDISLGDRLLSPFLLALLLTTGLSHSLMSSMAVRLRAHRREPLLLVSMVEAGIMIPSLIVLTHHFGIMGAVSSFVCIHGILAAIAVSLVFFKDRRQHLIEDRGRSSC